MTLKEKIRLKRAKALLKAYLAWLEKDKSQRETCDLEQFQLYDCCRFHRRLFREQCTLDGWAYSVSLTFGFQQEGGDPFCANWWKAFEAATGIAVPKKLTDLR